MAAKIPAGLHKRRSEGADSKTLERALAEPLHRPLGHLRQGLALLGGVALVSYPFVFTGPFPIHIMIMIFLYALMAQAWNILAGYCGQISLGHVVFFGIGAYASGFLFTKFGVMPWLGMGVGVVLSVIVAVLIGLPTLRLKGHYFAIATLVIGEIVQIVFLRWDAVGAASGFWLPIVRESPWRNFQFNQTKVPYYFIALVFLLAACAVVWQLGRSRLGYYFRAIREDPEAAASLGVNVTRYKAYAFMLSGGLMSLAGSFYAHYVLVVDPETVFPSTLSILVVLMAVMGGVGTLWGPVIGAAVLVPLSEATRIWFGGTGGTVDLMIYGVLIVLLSIYRPDGLVGLFQRRSTAVPTVAAPGEETP
ncbi:MAG: branched-chain amino acid ABC transporter permease [Deltaproteobacteria bacterium]|nr:branched-chain amino acid ABC transporter permease [Deltaproteobacteria bacterium]